MRQRATGGRRSRLRGSGLRALKLWHGFDYRGTPVYVHWSMTLLLAYAAVGALLAGLPALVAGAAYFGVLLVHEAGHAELARRLGYEVYRIELHTVIGLCYLEQPRTRQDDALIAWGGVLAQAGILVPCLVLRELLGQTSFPSLNVALVFGVYFNGFTMLMNLVPIAPLDGHKAWRLLRG